MGAGGSERVMSLLANAWATRGHTISLITLADVADDFYTLNPSVARIGLRLVKDSMNAKDRVFSGLTRIWSLRNAIRLTQPDVVISFIDQMNVTTLLALMGTRIPVVISERVSPLRYQISWPWRFLRRVTYPFSDALVMQSPTLIHWARRHIRACRIYVIPNPVMTDTAKPGPALGLSPFILAIGRLTRQKGFDSLIEAFALCAQQHPVWRLVILGDGPERSALEHLITSKQLAGRVLMPGARQDTSRWLGQADLFVLSSRFEGFPNALLEAMAAGLAVVSFACESGPPDIISHKINGLLVPEGDVEALSDAMNGLMIDESLRRSLGAKALEVRNRFDINTILAAWDAVIAQVTSGPGAPP